MDFLSDNRSDLYEKNFDGLHIHVVPDDEYLQAFATFISNNGSLETAINHKFVDMLQKNMSGSHMDTSIKYTSDGVFMSNYGGSAYIPYHVITDVYIWLRNIIGN